MSDTVKGNDRKLHMIIGAAIVIIIAILIGVNIYNSPQRRLERLLDLGNTYLDNGQYEEAVLSFEQAIAIDPMNERAYIGKAAAYVGMGDYEQAAATYATAVQTIPDGTEVWNAAEQFYLDYAQIYIDNGDYEKAISILEEGYGLLGSEKLHDKIGELVEEAEQKVEEERRASGIVDLPFDLRNITVNGYDLLEDHFGEIRGLYPTVEGSEWSDEAGSHFREDAADESSSYFITTSNVNDNPSKQSLWVVSGWNYDVYYPSGSTQASQAFLELRYREDADYDGLNVPIKPGNSYEDWCKVMQIDQIKERGSQPEPEEDEFLGRLYDFHGTGEYGYWFFMSDDYKCLYTEERDDSGTWCNFFLEPLVNHSGERILREYRIGVRIGTDGIINQAFYWCYL